MCPGEHLVLHDSARTQEAVADGDVRFRCLIESVLTSHLLPVVLQLSVQGMTCSACSSAVENALR